IFNVGRKYLHTSLLSKAHRYLGRESHFAASGEAATMKENRQADSLAARGFALIRLAEFHAFGRIIRKLERSIHHHFQIDVFFDDLARRHRVTFMKKILTPYFGWVDP